MSAIDITTPAWLEDAVCASVDPALFFPEQGDTPRPAKRICASCPAITQCLSWAVANGVIHGVYGGLTAHERRPLRKCRNCDALAARHRVYCGDECQQAVRAAYLATYRLKAAS